MKTALVIDGNYLLFKDVFILHYMKTLHKDLQKLLQLDVDRLSKMYHFDDIFFVSDSKIGYWRKIYFPGYKGKRKKDESIDWKWVYKEYDTLKSFIKTQTQISQLEFDLSEGDDIIAYIVNKNNDLGYSNVIIASDSDLQQLLRFDLSTKYINIIYNYKFSDEKLHLPENYNVFFSEMKRSASNTLFDMNNDDEYLMFLEELINKTKSIGVSTEELIFTKLIGGDKKDSVPSVYLKKTKTDKMMGIGKAGAKSIYNLYKETYNEIIDFDTDDFVDKSSVMVSFVKKVTDEITIDLIKENIKRNRKLLILTEKYLPNDLLDIFNNNISLTSNSFNNIILTDNSSINTDVDNSDIDVFFN